MTAGPPVKVVVWDLDGTVWPGVALEAPTPPRPEVLSALDTLAGRGILVSVASRNPASVGAVVEADPALAGRFVAPQYGWGRKADALRRIAEELEVQLGSVAFVDDDPFERADVERSLPEVVVLAPEEVPDALGWPEFDPGPVTAAGRSRVDSYRRRASRRAARAAFARRATRTSCAGASCARCSARPRRRTPTGWPSWPGGPPSTTRPARRTGRAGWSRCSS